MAAILHSAEGMGAPPLQFAQERKEVLDLVEPGGAGLREVDKSAALASFGAGLRTALYQAATVMLNHRGTVAEFFD